MNGKLIGIGVGPGDPELMTVKAVRVVQSADVVAYPVSKMEKDSVALAIANPYLTEKQALFPLHFPMKYDENELTESWDSAAEQVGEFLSQGKTVVFLTLGDPTVYSTYMYLHKRIAAMGYEVHIVPGVPSFCAAAAAAGISLAENKESFAILPSAYETYDVENYLKVHDNLVLMKAAKQIPKLTDTLKYHQTIAVSNCTMVDERIVTDLKEFEQEKGSYFTTVIVKKNI